MDKSMKKLLKSKAGVTILEGVIALGLLAVITGGAFGVLLSVSRQGTHPDVQEEMVWAVEKVNDLLKVYATYGTEEASLIASGLEGSCLANGTDPLDDSSTHTINCMLPPICDENNNSSFTYSVSKDNGAFTVPLNPDTDVEGDSGTIKYASAYGLSELPGPSQLIRITYNIRCNGYEL